MSATGPRECRYHPNHFPAGPCPGTICEYPGCITGGAPVWAENRPVAEPVAAENEAAAALAALEKELADMRAAYAAMMEAQADNVALQRQAERDLAERNESLNAAADEIIRLKRELEEARENAERYRKLKAEGGSITMTNGYVFGLEAADTTIDSWGGCPHGFNKKHNCPLCIMPAIEAARKGEK